MASTRRRYQKKGVVVAAGYLTTSRNYNVTGRSTCYALANSLKAKLNAHIASQGASAGEHKALHSAGVITAVDAVSVATLVLLTNDLTTKYALHNTDCAAGSPTYHMAQGTTRTLTSEAAQTVLSGCLTQLNDIKAKYNLHQADATGHRTGNLFSVATADGSLGAAIDIDNANVLAGDKGTLAILNSGTGTVTGVSAVGVNGALRCTFSADPQNDAIISYAAIRGI
jgi:hypothetical protein